ncbi:MAG TPA: asparaginase, partial [Thermoanaerobaculia bacterium]|nr:asparaginase [Thermoanaerobaculia bacterium]
MPFLESGGAERFGLSLDEIAVACASHVGSPAHVAAVESVLAKGGFSVADLRCGAHPPYDDASAAALVRQGIPFSALHNNCSGKHAAMLLACRLFGFDPATYDAPGHPLQGRILEKIAFYADFPAERIGIGVDGCSLPVFRLPVSRLAAAYARLLVSAALPQEAAPAFAARRRVVEAMTAAPFFVSGAGQFTTRFIDAGAGRWIGKEGAEGVYAIGVAAPVPLGLAFKIDDGGARARNPVAVDLLSRLGVWSEVPASLAGEVRPPITNVRGSAVGEVVVAVPVTASGKPPRAALDPWPRPVAARERA